MSSSDPPGKVTLMLARHVEKRSFKRMFRPTNDIADSIGAPKEWVVCHLCGSQAWRLPPHGIATPCPLIEQVAATQELKTDAERMTAIRAGVTLEEMSRSMRKQLGLEEEENE